MKTLIVGDLHITENSIEELRRIFEKDIFPIRADRIIQVGDWFENHRPTPKEQLFSSGLIDKLKGLYKEVIILSGNGRHDLLNGISAVEHFPYLGENIQMVKGDLELDGSLYGHFMMDKSRLEYGSHKYTVAQLKGKYKYVFLGHQHSYQELAEGMWHIGSVRYVGWNEVIDEYKILAMLDENGVEFIPIKNAIPMVDVYKMEDLDGISPDTKVRMVFTNFTDFKNNINKTQEYKDRFVEFKIKCDFGEVKTETQEATAEQKKTLKQIIQSYIDKIKDEDVKTLLKEGFKQ